MKFLDGMKTQVGIVLFLEAIAFALLLVLGRLEIAVALFVILAVNTTLVLWILNTIRKMRENQAIDVSRVLGKASSAAFTFGQVGLLTYNDQYEVTWVSEFMIQRDLNLVGKKATVFSKKIESLFQGEVDVVVVEKDDYFYEVTKKEDEHSLLIRDISKYRSLSVQYEEESLVIGMVHMDNYADIQAFEDETMIANVNLNLRQPIVDWASKNGVVIRRLRSDRFFLILNESIYKKISDDKFDILMQTRKRAAEIDANVTISMAFARGHIDIESLDDMANDLLELAQSRGGDQVAMKRHGDDVIYYGGKSEGTSTRSRVRVRVMAQSIKEIISESNQVFISGHKEMDFDCMGANLALSRLVESYGKKVYIVSQSGGTEKQLSGAMDYYDAHLSSRHQFISDEEACKLKKKNDLMIIADYHNPEHSNAPKLLQKMERVMVIDHHRRGKDFIHNPLLVYLESSASSSCELLSELISYQSGKVDISEVEATIMYLGVLVDTNRFKMRTGFRTFEACAQLKKWGVDPIEAESLLKEDFSEFEAKIKVMKDADIFAGNMIISCAQDDEIFTRSLMSIGADSMLNIKNIEATFVIARVDAEHVAISARSKGVINVQTIMERLHGGGHFSAAAVQRSGISTNELYLDLKKVLEEYLVEEDEADESNHDKRS